MQGFCLKNLIMQSLKHLLGVDPLHRHNPAQAASSFAMEGMPQNLRKTWVWVKPISWDRSSLANSGALSRTISDLEGRSGFLTDFSTADGPVGRLPYQG